MLDDMRQFHEQPHKVKKAWYCRKESGQRIFDYNTNVKNQWVDVPHRHGYLIANIRNFLQFQTVMHRVLAGRLGPRISATRFFAPTAAYRDKPYGPAEELLSEENPPIYKGTSFHQHLSYFRINGRDGRKALPHFKISS
ncbi:hypothetical protein POUND7_007547 [Theobroma cacao]